MCSFYFILLIALVPLLSPVGSEFLIVSCLTFLVDRFYNAFSRLTVMRIPLADQQLFYGGIAKVQYSLTKSVVRVKIIHFFLLVSVHGLSSCSNRCGAFCDI